MAPPSPVESAVDDREPGCQDFGLSSLALGGSVPLRPDREWEPRAGIAEQGDEQPGLLTTIGLDPSNHLQDWKPRA